MIFTALTFLLLVYLEMYKAQDCGILSTATPEVAEGELIRLEFIPVVGNTPTVLLRELVTLFDRQQEVKSRKVTETRDGSKYVYTISDGQPGRYFVICQDRKYSNELNIDVISRSDETEQEFCGNLTKISKTNSVGSTIQLLFIPNEPNYNMEWFHWTGTKYQRLDKHNRSKYEETIGRNNQLFVFKISKSTKSDEGFYKAHCGSGAYSNIVLLNIVVLPPTLPRLSVLQNFTNCKNCIKALPGRDVVVTCSSDGGSPPVVINIFKNGELKKTKTSLGNVAGMVFKFRATPEYNWAEISCTVKNDATEVPLSTSATVYLYQIPSQAVFSMPVILEGSESKIACSVFRGRPAPYIKFMYNNTFENYKNTETFNVDTGTYNVTSTFQRTLHRWDNNEVLRCCVEHDLITGTITCNSVVLDVKYLPDSIHLREQSRHALTTGYTKITLLCSTGESNPVSNISWTGIEKIQSKLFSAAEQDGEYGGSQMLQVMSVWAGREHFGTEIACDVTNRDFPHLRMSSRFMINVTYPPNITISGDSNRVAGGQVVKVICSVDSNPPANVTWWTEEPRNISQDVSTLQEAVLYFKSAQLEDSGTYFCTAENIRGISTRNISLVVNDSLTYEKGSIADSSDMTPIVAGVLGAVIALAVVISIVIVRNRRHKLEHHVYSNAANSEFEPAEYASVIPKSQRQNVTKVNNTTKVEASPPMQELVYAELDLDTQNTTAVFKQPMTEATEYVELDFKNKAPTTPDT